MEIVESTAPYIEYPLTLITSTASRILTPRKPQDEKDSLLKSTKRFFTFEVDGTSDLQLDGLQGIFYFTEEGIRRGRHLDHGLIAQRGFTVSDSSKHDYGFKSQLDASTSGFSLFPIWISIEAYINLSGQSKLTLNPSRNDVIKDSQFLRIRTALDIRIAEALQRHLEDYASTHSLQEYGLYIDDLLEEKVLIAERWIGFELTPAATNLYRKMLVLPAISENGVTEYVYVSQIHDSNIIVSTSPTDWPVNTTFKQIRELINDEVKNTIPVLLQRDPGEYTRNSFVDILLGETNGYFITSTPCVVIDIRNRSGEFKPDFHIDGEILMTHNLHSYNHQDVICVHPAAPAMLAYPVFNAEHHLLSTILNQNEHISSESKKLLVKIGNVIADTITKPIAQSLPHIIYSDQINKENSSSANLLLLGIFFRHPELLISINEQIETIWVEAHKNRAVQENIVFQELTEDDFPWFWSYSAKSNSIVEAAQ